MKKRNLKSLKLNRRTISKVSILIGGVEITTEPTKPSQCIYCLATDAPPPPPPSDTCTYQHMYCGSKMTCTDDGQL